MGSVDKGCWQIGETIVSLSPAERETSITFNDADGIAYITTHQRKIITKLKRNPAFTVTSTGLFEGTEWIQGHMPAELVSFRQPRAKRELTEDQRQALRDRLSAARGR